MKILVAGGHGQVGRALSRRGAARGHEVFAPGRADMDVCRPDQVEAVVAAAEPDVVINAAGYTAVDRAENDRQAALAVNCGGAVAIALACNARGLPMFHLSTDYVFDGEKAAPYRESDRVRPINVYGESKAAGEVAVRNCNPGATIVRTSWVFGLEGQNFVRTIQRLARERPVLRVVADQRGCPTFADHLADALLDLAARADNPPLLHFCGDEPTTWHGFAEAIVGGPGSGVRIEAITTAEYPTPARRPRSSVLDTSLIRALGIVPPSWRVGLGKMLET
jgi:dTDP-4-dehydrorhamnose reductase